MTRYNMQVGAEVNDTRTRVGTGAIPNDFMSFSCSAWKPHTDPVGYLAC